MGWRGFDVEEMEKRAAPNVIKPQRTRWTRVCSPVLRPWRSRGSIRRLSDYLRHGSQTPGTDPPGKSSTRRKFRKLSNLAETSPTHAELYHTNLTSLNFLLTYSRPSYTLKLPPDYQSDFCATSPSPSAKNGLRPLRALPRPHGAVRRHVAIRSARAPGATCADIRVCCRRAVLQGGGA